MYLKVIHVGIVHGGAVGCDVDYEEEEYYYYHDIIVTIIIMIIFLSCSLLIAHPGLHHLHSK